MPGLFATITAIGHGFMSQNWLCDWLVRKTQIVNIKNRPKITPCGAVRRVDLHLCPRISSAITLTRFYDTTMHQNSAHDFVVDCPHFPERVRSSDCAFFDSCGVVNRLCAHGFGPKSRPTNAYHC